MPGNDYIKITIDGEAIDIAAARDFPLSISYSLEDVENFQTKKSSEAFDVVVPITTTNDRIANTFHNPNVEDLTGNQAFKEHRAAVVEANGHELLIGKAFLQSAKHNVRPLSYTYNFYGNNGDWIIALRETTLYDFLKHISFTFTKPLIENSWLFDGRTESLPFVFAPVRYGEPFEPYFGNFVDVPPPIVEDYNLRPVNMRPAISVYWLIYWGFKSLGYRISSSFFDTDYFRRAVMPWSWGNFLFSEGTRLNDLDFLAKSTDDTYYSGDFNDYLDLKVTNDSFNGAFDNNGSYQYNTPAKEMKWTYLPAFNYGLLEATFHLQIFQDSTVSANSDVSSRVRWYKNGSQFREQILVDLNAPAIGRRDFADFVDDYATVSVQAGDVITAKIYLHHFESSLGRANTKIRVEAIELDYFKIPLGGTIDFKNYTGLKKWKFLDFLTGVIDAFNLSPGTDPINKVVYFEPTHPYSLTNNFSQLRTGYLNGDFIDWSGKQDLLKESDLSLFSDYEREVFYRFKDDSNDGILKLVQDRYQNQMAAGKYVFPNRFKSGKKEVENRFFSPVMHFEKDNWRGFGTDATAAPQLICMIPENKSNTSRAEAQNTFNPKLAWYKGLVNHVGWLFDGIKRNNYPYMFAVNYQQGGENDPVLSYSDERIGTGSGAVIARGLLRRFYLQRLAIIRNGVYYDTHFKLNNIDITNWLHREHIICRGARWELVQIKNYKPLHEQTTQCFLRKWVPIGQEDAASLFPSTTTVLDTAPATNAYDVKYSPLKCLPSDIPTTTE